MAQLLQTVLAGLTTGAIYALAALGFTLIFNASHVVNFAQGEFMMLGGMSTAALVAAGVPLWLAIPLGVAVTVAVGAAFYRFAIAPVKKPQMVTLVIITVGASLFLRGVAQIVWDKGFHAVPPFSGAETLHLAGASVQPQSLWVLGVAAALIGAVGAFFNRTLAGKAMLAVSYNPLAAKLVGIDGKRVLLAAFSLSAGLGALGGIVVAPITFTSADVGIMLGLKGFAAAVLGGLGSGAGAVAGGLIVGLAEALAAGYLSSAYKDAVAFVIILAVLVAMPNGLLGRGGGDRV